MSACRNLEVGGNRGRGTPRVTWRARLDEDMKDMGPRPGMATDREKWRCRIMGRTSEWGYEGYGAEARDGNGPREVEVWPHGENVRPA